MSRSALALLVLGVVLMGLGPQNARAQSPQPTQDTTGKIVAGSIPADGSFGLIVYGGGTYEQLITASKCPRERVVFWVTREGRFLVFVPGSTVAAPNEAFQAAFPRNTIPANTGMIGRCAPGTPGVLSGIEGLVTIGPVCPVVIDPGILPCSDQPYEADIVVYQGAAACPVAGCAEAAHTRSGKDGRYRVLLPPGPYTVVPLPPDLGLPFPRSGPISVVVPSGLFAVVDIHFDSGIRSAQ
jgi:hypothetical protein